MAVIVVGGQSRNIGKTSVVAGLISALPAYNWTAFKITQLSPDELSLEKNSVNHTTRRYYWTVTEEHDTSGKSDTSRFLVAGAKRAFWVRTERGHLGETMPVIQSRITEAGNVIIESNSILQFIQPDLYITVLDPATADVKESAQTYMEKADAIVLHETQPERRKWNPDELVLRKPVFRITPPTYVNADLVQFVTERLKAKP